MSKVLNANARRSDTRKGIDSVRVPPPATISDWIILEIRKFIATAIFFKAQAADKVGLGLTDLQIVHLLQLYGPTTPKQLGLWTRLSSAALRSHSIASKRPVISAGNPIPVTAEAC